MTTIVTTDFTQSTTADANAVNANFTAVKNVVNGSLDNNNLASNAAIAVTKLAAGSSGQVLKTVGSTPTWSAPTTPTYMTVATFSGLSPADGDEVYLVVDDTNGVVWHLRYVSAETTYKWRFLGGAPMVSEIDTTETTASTSYAALSTAGPSIALPRAGDYDIEIGADMSNNTDAAGAIMSYDIGGTGAADADQALVRGGGSGQSRANALRPNRKTALTAVTLTAKYKTSGSGTASFSNRLMRVTPVRIRHDA